MDEYGRPRKQIRKDATAAKRRGSTVSRGVRAGRMKGKPKAADERLGASKPSSSVSRRTASEAERVVSGRRELPLPIERTDVSDRAEGRSLRLSLRVEGDQISVVNAIEVDAPARELQPVRGSSFVEVRMGDQVLALEPLIDPGISIGIPDPRDKEEFRGHRELQQPSYEVAVRVPLDLLESAGEADRRGALEISVYDATETLELDPVRTDAVRDARRRLARVATTGRLGVDEVRSVSRAGDRKSPPRE
jgi:hypothetical protein